MLSECIKRKQEERALFAALWEGVRQGAYGADFAERIEAFSDRTKNEAALSFFMARLALSLGEAEAAYALAKKAYERRKVSPAIWRLLVEAGEATGRGAQVRGFSVLLAMYGKRDAAFQGVPESEEAFALPMSWAPFRRVMAETPDGDVPAIESSQGRFLPEDLSGQAPYFCAMYHGDAFFDARAFQMQAVDKDTRMEAYACCNILFEIGRGKMVEAAVLHDVEEPAILPVAGLGVMSQDIEVEGGGRNAKIPVGLHEWRFLRMEGKARLSSERPFVCGTPVRLGHSPKRKKLVLSLFLDGLSFPVMRRTDYRHIPNLMRFFQKGVIFSHAYSPAEYTFPSTAAIETGLFLHHSQIFHEMIYAPLAKSHVTLSEQMKALGYYCVSVSGDGRGVYNGATRGFDRLIFCPYLAQPAAEAVERAIDHLDAFSETDCYLSVHVSDPHQFPSESAPLARKTQTALPWQEAGADPGASDKTVFLQEKKLYQLDNSYHIARMDQAIGRLLDYVEAHYSEDEYIVAAYSDHGVPPIWREQDFLLSEDMTGAALMLRGAGVPSLGQVQELVSSLDLYPTLGKLAGFSVPQGIDGNLPAVFGGHARDVVFSNSIFPGQTYKLAIRTRAHEAYIETKKPTRMDGTIDMDGALLRVYTRDAAHQAVKQAELDAFFWSVALDFVASFDTPDVPAL